LIDPDFLSRIANVRERAAALGLTRAQVLAQIRAMDLRKFKGEPTDYQATRAAMLHVVKHLKAT
jgi:hypothetical protein